MLINKIIVTGATGAVGSAVVRKALECGWHVTCLVHEGSNRVSNIPDHENVDIIECNVSNYYQLDLKETFDVFIHLSWEKTFGAQRDDVDIQVKNIQYTLDACRLAKRLGCKKFIGAGSQAEYGVTDVDLAPILRVNPESGYGIAKFASGKMSALLCKQIGLEFNWVRILSVYGPNDGKKTFISYLIDEFKAGNSPKVTRCEQIWDYLYSDDAGSAFLAIAKRGIDGKTYVLGSGDGRKMSEFVEDIRLAINPSIEVQYGAIGYYPHQPMHLVADISELTADTDWKPNTKFVDGIKQILEWQ